MLVNIDFNILPPEIITNVLSFYTLSGSQEVTTNMCVDMVHHANDSPYPTTNTPLLTTHFVLIVCGALRHQYLCDDDSDRKEYNCAFDVAYTLDQFSWKQRRKAMILALRRQKPLTNALDGLYLPCAVCKLRVLWDESCAESLRFHTPVLGESRRGVPSPTMV